MLVDSFSIVKMAVADVEQMSTLMRRGKRVQRVLRYAQGVTVQQHVQSAFSGINWMGVCAV